MKREDLDTRVRDLIIEYISRWDVPGREYTGYCGDLHFNQARGLFRHLRENGCEIVLPGPDVVLPGNEPNILRPLMERFRRPKYQDHTTYCRGFAERVIDAIYDAGMEIRT
jgi:hypothetical protein